jgi:hypothetical protein
MDTDKREKAKTRNPKFELRKDQRTEKLNRSKRRKRRRRTGFRIRDEYAWTEEFPLFVLFVAFC